MSNWRTVRLGDVCDTISATYKKGSKSVVLINTSDVLVGKVLNHKKELNENLKGQFKKTFQRDDILYSEIRPQNRRFAFIDFEPTDYIASTKLMVLRCKECILPKYLFQILSSDEIIQNLQALAETRSGTFPQITFSELSTIEIQLPSLEEQGRIAGILGALDDKIECNNRINRNLEEKAAALFRRWFVDFEFPDPDPTSPTYGKPYRSSGCIMQDSPLGSIPQGWQVGTFRDIISSTIGGDWGKENAEANYSQKVYCIRGADITDVSKGEKGKMPFRYILPKNHTAKKLEVNDLVIEISGGSPTQSTGRIALISDSLLQRYDEDMICTNFCRAIKPKIEYAHFIYSLWRYMYDQNIMFSYENGTTGIKNLNINGLIDNEQIVIPPIEVLNDYNNLQKQFFNIIFTNALESEVLATLRDTLLPKLMNNEIKIETHDK